MRAFLICLSTSILFILIGSKLVKSFELMNGIQIISAFVISIPATILIFNLWKIGLKTRFCFTEFLSYRKTNSKTEDKELK